MDDNDYDRVSQYTWYEMDGYARCSFLSIQMHRFILGLAYSDKREVDHRNHDGLDNRRTNLRLVTRSQQLANTKPRSNTSSSYKGVTWRERNKKWQAQINTQGTTHHLGLFTDELEASKAYDEAAIRIFGEYAYLNHPSVESGEHEVKGVDASPNC